MGHLNFLLDEMGLDETGLDEMALNRANPLHGHQSLLASSIHVVSYQEPWLFLLFWAQCTHTQLLIFLLLFLL